MTIALWLITLIGYLVFLVMLPFRVSDLSILAGIISVVVGVLSLALNQKTLLLFSYGLLLLGELLLYNAVLRTGSILIWLAAIVATIFLGVLAQRSD